MKYKRYSHNSGSQGFTIIEVVLVLALAGVLFALVFTAFSGLQASRRDSQRQADISQFQKAIQNFQDNNRGALPNVANNSSREAFEDGYMRTDNKRWTDPSGAEYTIVDTGRGEGSFPADAAAGDGRVYAKLGASCGENRFDESTSNRKIAFAIRLESGGFHCVNN